MKKEKLKELYEFKIKEFNNHNFLYFEKNNPKISENISKESVKNIK